MDCKVILKQQQIIAQTLPTIPMEREMKYHYFDKFSTTLWSSSDDFGSSAWDHYLDYYSTQVYRGADDKNFSLSVRCLKD